MKAISSSSIAAMSAVVAIFASGCATPYQKTGLTGAYSETELRWNEFVVAFGGNGYTSGQRAVDLCLVRCADLTMSHGFNYFLITGGRNAVDASTSVTSGSYVSTGYGSGVCLSASQQIAKPSTVNRILCFRQKPAGVEGCFDAQAVFAKFNEDYRLGRQSPQPGASRSPPKFHFTRSPN